MSSSSPNSIRPPPPRQLRALILDYLVQRCYTRTARAFAADSTIRHLDADGDEIRRPHGEDDSPGITEEALHQADLRRDVQTNILSGRIDDAIDCLNDNFPSTLPSSVSTFVDTGPSTPKAERSQSRFIKTVLPSTVEPAHLHLDLRILAFIEASRTKPLLYSHTRPAIADPEPSLRISLPNNFRDPSGEHVHELYDCAQALQDPQERAEYLHELSTVSSLLAYKVPEQSPMAKFLTQDRREGVADEINSAILHRAGYPPISYLELYVRYNTVIWNYMNEHEFRVAPSRGWPTGIVHPSRPQPIVPSVPSGAKVSMSRKDDSEVVPAFNLNRFLST
ncbi:CTLH/CRA C-terminal to lish motif domain-containing protein [Russula brevipes]|nr:CTLH/CRA C-terminal to lish motif domain-containing protein [Russula brevipes]